jgi:hypothetical protein
MVGKLPTLLERILNVYGCDARDDDSSDEAYPNKNKFEFSHQCG